MQAKRRTVWQGKSWSFDVETVTLPDGQTLERGIIDHPGAVVLVPVRPSPAGPELLLLRQYRYALNDTIYELPAGTRGWQEPWLACAQRELREETGCRADAFLPLGRIWPAPGISSEMMALFLATGLHADPLPMDADEQIERVPTLLDTAVTMTHDGRIQDAKSIIGILRAAAHLSQTPL